MAYLDDTGLAYFWGKLKAWANGLFVHLSGDETVDGVKTFMRGFVQKDGFYERGVTTTYTQNNLCHFKDKNDAAYGVITCVVNADKSGGIRMYAYDTTATSGNNIGYLGIGCTSSGNVETYAPTPAYTEDYYQLATTKWVRRHNRMVCNYSKTIDKPYTLIATTASRLDYNYADLSITLLVDRPYANGFGGCGICQINLRTDNAGLSEPAYCQFTWLARTGNIGDCIRIGLINTPGNAACDIYFHNTVEYRTGMITVLSQSANRYNNPNQYHPAAGFHTFCSETDDNNTRSYSTMNDGAQALWGENYTTTYTVGEEKYFSTTGGDVTGNVNFVHNAIRGTAPASMSERLLWFYDSNQTKMGALSNKYNTDKSSSIGIYVYDTTVASGNSIAAISIGCDSSGDVFTQAPTPPLDSNSTQIATTAWVRSHTHGSMLQLQNSNITKGSNPTSTQYWAVYACDKNGTAYAANALGLWETNVQANGTVSSYVRALKNAANATNSCSLGAGYYTSSSTPFVFCTGNIQPNSGITCGTSSYKWSAIWATNGTIQTSDERVKTEINSIPNSVLDAWEEVQWKQFKMKESVEQKGDGARLHTGIIAQQIQSVFNDKNIDPANYGFFCWDKWNDSEAILDADGNVILEAVKADEQYSVRYEEALCIEAAYQRRENARLRARIADLEERLAALELKIS